MKHIREIGLMALLLITFSARGQGQVQLSADTIALGDQTVLSLPMSQAAQLTPGLGSDAIEVVDQQIDTAKQLLLTTLTCFEPGEHYIHLGEDDSLRLVVTDVEVDTASTDIRDIAPIIKVPYTFWEIFRWILLALGIGAIGFGIWWILTHRKKVESILGIGEPVDQRDPRQRATDELEALRLKQLWQSGKVKEYHTELTDVVRRFIEESTGIHATEMTSDETLDSLSEQHIGGDLSDLRQMLTTADLVKFAKSEPLPHEHDRSMQQACKFIEQLWEQVKPTEETKEEGNDE